MGFGERLSNAADRVGRTLDTAIQLKGQEAQDIRQSKFARELEDIRAAREESRQKIGFEHAEKMEGVRFTNSRTVQGEADTAALGRQNDEQLFEAEVKNPHQLKVAETYASGRGGAADAVSPTDKRAQKVLDDSLKAWNAANADGLAEPEALARKRADIARQVVVQTGDPNAAYRFYLGTGLSDAEARAEATKLASAISGPRAPSQAAPPPVQGTPPPVPSASATPAAQTPPPVQGTPPPLTGGTAEEIRQQKQDAMFGKRPVTQAPTGNMPWELPRKEALGVDGDLDALSKVRRAKFDRTIKESTTMLAKLARKGSDPALIAKKQVTAFNRARDAAGLPEVSEQEALAWWNRQQVAASGTEQAKKVG